MGAVLLSKRDTFLTLEEFNGLLYMSGVCSYGGSSLNTKSGKKISVADSETFIQAHPPSIIRPQILWTGKQVGSTPYAYISFAITSYHILSSAFSLLCEIFLRDV